METDKKAAYKDAHEKLSALSQKLNEALKIYIKLKDDTEKAYQDCDKALVIYADECGIDRSKLLITPEALATK